jgi:hypothetical protein
VCPGCIARWQRPTGVSQRGWVQWRLKCNMPSARSCSCSPAVDTLHHNQLRFSSAADLLPVSVQSPAQRATASHCPPLPATAPHCRPLPHLLGLCGEEGAAAVGMQGEGLC